MRRSGARPSEIALGALFLGIAGCSSFDPVSGTRFKLLNQDTYAELDMPDAHWAAYDDQHSARFQCTNGAAGNHDSSKCSSVTEPRFEWTGPKCIADLPKKGLDQGLIQEHKVDGIFEPICIRGVLHHREDCLQPGVGTRCRTYDGDTSNIWGVGVGLTFSADSKTGWNAESHHVKGVAFEVTGSTGTLDKLRVGIPTVLDPDTAIPAESPLIRTDGTVVDTEGNLYDCHTEVVPGGPVARAKLRDVNVEDPFATVTSDQHPNASPFWQSASTPSWTMSPAVEGQNRFDLSEVLPPPLSTDLPVNPVSYPFTRKTQILGIHFQVVQPKENLKEDFEFSLCIKNLAFILE